jgi:hypothetical protein
LATASGRAGNASRPWSHPASACSSTIRTFCAGNKGIHERGETNGAAEASSGARRLRLGRGCEAHLSWHSVVAWSPLPSHSLSHSVFTCSLTCSSPPLASHVSTSWGWPCTRWKPLLRYAVSMSSSRFADQFDCWWVLVHCTQLNWRHPVLDHHAGCVWAACATAPHHLTAAPPHPETAAHPLRFSKDFLESN